MKDEKDFETLDAKTNVEAVSTELDTLAKQNGLNIFTVRHWYALKVDIVHHVRAMFKECKSEWQITVVPDTNILRVADTFDIQVRILGDAVFVISVYAVASADVVFYLRHVIGENISLTALTITQYLHTELFKRREAQLGVTAKIIVPDNRIVLSVR